MKGVLKLEVEKIQIGHFDLDNMSESGSVTNDSVDAGDRTIDSTFSKSLSNGSDGPRGGNLKWNVVDGKDVRRNDGSVILGNYPDGWADAVSAKNVTNLKNFSTSILTKRSSNN